MCWTNYDGNRYRARQHLAFVARIVALGFLTVAWVSGCGLVHPAVAPVTGRVTVNGKPLQHGRVSFEPVPHDGDPYPGRPAYGRIQPDGTYDDDDGAVVGEHRVTLFGTTGDDELDGTHRPRFEILRLVGQRYYVSDDDSNELDITLTTEIIKRFGKKDD